MAAAIEWNLNHAQRDARLFEIGRQYRFVAGQPLETPVLTIGATGVAREQGLYDGAREFSFADLKGDLDSIGELSGGFHWQAGGPDWLNPSQRGEIRLNKPDGPVLGAAGQVSKRILEKLKFRQEVFIAELEVGPLYCMYYGSKNNRRFKPLPRFPGVERDFSLLLANHVTFAEVKKAIDSLAIPEIASVRAVDLFRGKSVPEGKYSLLVRVLFQSSEATLTEAQLNAFSTRIITALEKTIGATLRAS